MYGNKNNKLFQSESYDISTNGKRYEFHVKM